jgi:hypothetical protein
MTLRELMDLAAPRLSQDEEIFAIGLAEGAQEFLGPDIASLFKGERVLSTNTIQLVLDAIRSGALGQSQILSSDTAQSVVNFVSTALQQVPRQRRTPTSTGGGNSGKQDRAEIYNILNNLPSSERARLDTILEELTSRAILRVLQRLDNR